MNTPIDANHLLSHGPIVSTYDQLVCVIHRCRQVERWRRLLRNPIRPFLTRLGFPRHPYPWQETFLAHSAWPQDVRSQLRTLPAGFITDYSLQPDAAYWLYDLIRRGDFDCIIECGCGISTVLIALAKGNRPIQFASLEHDEHWLRLTHQTLTALGLSDHLTLIHAPLTPISFADHIFQAHDDSHLNNIQAGLLVVDAPHGSFGRAGVLARLARHLRDRALVVLDDAERPWERECVAMWIQAGLADLRGYVPLGNGLALLTKASRGSISRSVATADCRVPPEYEAPVRLGQRLGA